MRSYRRKWPAACSAPAAPIRARPARPLLIIVVGAFSASGVTFIKLMGVGMIVALLVDATIIRVLLVPATMRLLGRANWWAPRPLRRLYARYGIKEEIEAERARVPV